MAKESWLCTGCNSPKPGVGAIDIMIRAAPKQPSHPERWCILDNAHHPPRIGNLCHHFQFDGTSTLSSRLPVESIIIFAQTSIATRLAGGGLIMIAGIAFILVGTSNIRTQTAQESGKRRTVNRFLGKSNSYRGNSAVLIGVTRIIGGIFGIGAGIAFMIFGAFAAGPGATGAADQRRPGVGDEFENVQTQFDAWRGEVEQQPLDWFAEQTRQLDEEFGDRVKQNLEEHAKRREDIRKRMDEFHDDSLKRHREFIEPHWPSGALGD